MQFLQPIMFWALSLIPMLILLHLLRPKPQQIEVTNLFLWQEILKERGQRVAFKHLRKNLPLLLQILLVILGALALARPVWFYFSSKKGEMILVIDTSASMKTRLSSGTRFDLAREKALELIDQRKRHQKILLINADYDPTIMSGFLEDTDQAREMVNSLTPTDAPGKLEQAVYLALSFVDPAKDDMIYLITDGADASLSEILQMRQRILPHLVSGGETNLGITKFEFRQELDRPHNYQIMLEVKNFSPVPLECPLRLSIDRQVIVDTAISLESQEKQLFIFPYFGLISGIATAELDIEDDFAVDNTAYLSLTTTEDIWVLLVSKGSYFLEKLLETYPNVLVNKLDEIILSSWEQQVMGHDIIIVDRLNFPPTTKGNFLLLDSYSPSIPVTPGDQIAFPQVYDWDSRHPILADVNLSNLLVEQTQQLQINDDAVHPLIETQQTSLMLSYEHEGLRAILLGFDIARSNLPLKVAFPVMMSNIITWLNPHKLSLSVLQTKAGEPYPIHLSPFTESFSLRPPGERWQKQQVTENPVIYRDTTKVGVYMIAEDKQTRYFTVNLVNEAESDIAPAVHGLEAVFPEETQTQEQIKTQQPLWMAFLLAVLGITMLEWYVWLKVG